MSQAATISTQQNVRAGAPLLEIRALAKNFGKHQVLKAVSLDIASGEFITLLGESGSGKTTMLRLIAGFEQPSSGEIWMNGQRLDQLPPYKRRVNTVFQQYALFPHLTVRDNVAYGLRVTKTPPNEIAARVDDALRMVKMDSFASARPTTLSGGQQQRVSLARALVNRPLLLLLDEPLSALDANLRKQMQSELKSLQREVGITFLFVTHDQEEAMALSDRIALLRDGALEQIASPREIYQRPATAYTAQFIGQTNLLQAEVHNGIATCSQLRWPTSSPDGPTLFSLRPEAIQLADSPATPSAVGADARAAPNAVVVPGPKVRFSATVKQQLYGGATELLELDCSGQPLRAKIPARGPLQGVQNFVFSAEDAVHVSG